MQKTKTKKALLASLLSMLVCLTMLIGSTFAWFTDSVTSGNNRIQAGNLKIDLLMDKQDGKGYVSIADGEGDIFDEAEIAQNSSATLWEPGKTQIVYLGVQNQGSLALKYNILLDVTDNGLVGALEYAVLDGAQADALTDVTDWEALKAAAGAQQTGDIKAGRTTAAPNGRLDEIVNGIANETDYFALAVHMKEDAGNEYQGKDITIDVTVIATQATAESDSFDDQYDANAEYADIYVSSEAEFTQALADAEDGDIIALNPGTEIAGHVVIDKDVTIIGGEFTFDANDKEPGNEANHAIVIEANRDVTLKDCTLNYKDNGIYMKAGDGNIVIEGCTFGNGNRAMWINGGNTGSITIRNNTIIDNFNLEGYLNTPVRNVTIENNTFNNSLGTCSVSVSSSLENVVFKNNTYNQSDLGSLSQSLVKVYYYDGANYSDVVFEDNSPEGISGQMVIFNDDNAKQGWDAAVTSGGIQGVTSDYQQA